MKKVRNLILLVFLVLMLCACTKTNEQEAVNNNTNDITGTWYLVNMYDDGIDEKAIESSEDYMRLMSGMGMQIRFIFNSDGSGSMVYDTDDVHEFEYKLDGNSIWVKTDTGESTSQCEFKNSRFFLKDAVEGSDSYQVLVFDRNAPVLTDEEKAQIIEMYGSIGAQEENAGAE